MPGRSFEGSDHRSFRLSDEILRDSVELLDPFWRDAAEMGLSPTEAALGYAASVPGVSTVIPGIRTPEQAEQNAAAVVEGSERVRALVEAMPADASERIVALMHERG